MKGIASVIMIVVFGAGVCAASLVHADESVVTNNISVSAETGGNTVSTGTVRNGTSETSVHIQQTINGVAEPPITITASSSGSAHITAHMVTMGNGDHVTSTRSVTTTVETSRIALASITIFLTSVFHWITGHI